MIHPRPPICVFVIIIAALLCASLAQAEAPIIRLVADTTDLDLAFIRNGELVTNFNYENARGVIARYTGVDLGEPVQKVTCKARFYGGGAVALVSTPDAEWSVEGITRRSIHAVFTSTSYHFGFYEDGVLSDVLAGDYALDVSGETEYTFGFSIARDTVTFTLPTGKTVKKIDERVKACNGSRVIFEHYLTAEDVQNGHAAAITYAYATGKAGPALEDTFQRRDGLPFESPTGHAWAQFRNESPEDFLP